MKKYKILTAGFVFIFVFIYVVLFAFYPVAAVAAAEEPKKDYIKWMDFTPGYRVLEKTLDLDIKSHGTDKPLHWIDLLAYLAAKYGGEFVRYREKDLTKLVNSLKAGKPMDELAADMKYYSFYHEAYTAVLEEFVGDYEVQVPTDNGLVYEQKYGLKVFSPIAKGYWYSDYDDFGAGRSYGYRREHLGHDMFASLGTPVIAVETGTIQAMGWNQYGGWRVGIRSLDGKRYYYYAHMRRNHPFPAGLAVGQTVKAGDVIGYVGRTGNSTVENTNNVKDDHLHFGMQIIFDPSQETGPKEIWIDVYAITRLLQKNKSEVVKDEAAKEYHRKYDFKEALAASADALMPTMVNMQVENQREIAGQARNDTGMPPSSAPAAALFRKKDARESVKVPIVMYHVVSNSQSRLGKYGVTPAELELDLKYLKENGYTTVVMQDLINYVQKGTTLPEKPVALTFDDGNYGDWRYVLPLLRKYDMKAVSSIIGSVTDQYSAEGRTDIVYPHLVWEQVREMVKSGLFEIQNHSYDMHKAGGSGRKNREGEDAYRTRLSGDIQKFDDTLKDQIGKAPTTYTYPFGIMGKGSTQILKALGYEASLSCTEGASEIKQGDADSLFMLKRCLRPHHKPIWKILGQFS